MSVRLGSTRFVPHQANGRRQLAPARVGSSRCPARRIGAAAQDDHAAAIRQVPLRRDGAPARRQALPAVEQRADVPRDDGPLERERRPFACPGPVGKSAFGTDRVERRAPAVVAVRGGARQEPSRAAGAAELSARVVSGPEQRALQLAPDDRLDRGPGVLRGVDRVEQARPAGRRQPPPEARLGIVRLLGRRQLGAGRAQPLGDLHGGLPRGVGRRLRRIALRLG